MFTITAPALPGATFFNRAALLRHAGERLQYEQVVKRYAKDRDWAALSDGLTMLGYDQDDIRWHADNPGRRLRMGYF